jgi:NAD(P)-dependent dehydrogenase (short-subunit alcohol dehydrogenase family)
MAAQQAQKVLITAGAGGIGRAIAAAFVATGARVHVCDLDAQALDQLRAEMPGTTTSVCDVSDRAQVQAMVQHAAGEAVLRVNLTGTFTVTQFAIPHLKKSSAASIVVMSSLAGRFGYPNRSPYSTTKWGLIGFTKTLSRELGEFGIRVNAILPGAVDGARLQQVFQGRAAASGRTVAEEQAAALANQSIKRFVAPADIAALAVFLASDAGRSISGQLLPIDGDSQSAA